MPAYIAAGSSTRPSINTKRSRTSYNNIVTAAPLTIRSLWRVVITVCLYMYITHKSSRSESAEHVTSRAPDKQPELINKI